MPRLSLALTGLALAVATACSAGDGGSPAPRRAVDVVMTDIAFSPTTLAVTKGETITFRFRNDGKLDHDAYVGDAAAQQEHEKDMRADKGGGHGHDDTDAITVKPGQTGELTHTFDEAGTFEVGCHQPGHYAAGMKITVTVT